MALKQLLLPLLILFLSPIVAQEVNYEQKALDYFLNKIENGDLFKNTCDCKQFEYNTKLPLVILQESSSSVNQALGICKVGLPWNDSLLNTKLDWKKVKLKLKSNQQRIQFTKNLQDFNNQHYFLQFADRLLYKNRVVIELNIRPKESCSGVNYIFLFNEKGEIEKHQLLVLCDSHR